MRFSATVSAPNLRLAGARQLYNCRLCSRTRLARRERLKAISLAQNCCPSRFLAKNSHRDSAAYAPAVWRRDSYAPMRALWRGDGVN